MNGEGSMDLLVSQVSNRTLVRRVVKKESERSFPFSVHSDMSVSDVIFDLFEKKTAKNVSERMRARVIGPMNHVFICSYMYYIYVFKTVVTQRVITI